MSEDWFYAADGQQTGPVSWVELRRLVEQDKLKATDLVWNESLPAWTEAGKVEGLVPKPTVRLPPPLPQTASPPALPDAAQANKVTGEVRYLGTGGSSFGSNAQVVWVELDGKKIGEGTIEGGFHLRFETTVGQHTLKLAFMLPMTESIMASLRGEKGTLKEFLVARTPFALHSPGHYVINLKHPRRKFTAIFGNTDHWLPSQLDIAKK